MLGIFIKECELLMYMYMHEYNQIIKLYKLWKANKCK